MLKVSRLSLRFDHRQVLDNVSFDLKPETVLGVVGESGSGKSVMAYAITGLLPKNAIIESGDIYFKGDNLIGKPLNAMQKLRGKKIAMIFQEPMTSLNPSIRCGEQVAEAIRQHESLNEKEIKQRVLSLFEKVVLPNPDAFYQKYPHQISGGQKQRVMIAMAISCNPDLLIADEPTTALDVTVQKEIISLLKSLQKSLHMSMIFISHDLALVRHIADEVMVLYQGKIIEHGNTTRIFDNPSRAYTQALIACRPTMGSRLKNLPTVANYMDSDLPFVKVYETIQERQAHQTQLYAREPLLVIKNLCKYYEIPVKGLFSKKTFFKAVDYVNFNIFPHETVGLVGESGCGKTTLSRTLLYLQKPTSGEILYRGKDLATYTPKQWIELRKEIQIIFQDPYSNLNPRKKVGQIIMEPMQVHQIGSTEKERWDRTKYLIDKVGLPLSCLTRYPHAFSGGQRQRIGIARVLGLNPKFIICDESVSALDVSVQAQVLNLLNELKHEFGLTYLFISHDLSIVKYMSNQLLVMNQGKIVEKGDADQIYQHPAQVYTQTLIQAAPKI